MQDAVAGVRRNGDVVQRRHYTQTSVAPCPACPDPGTRLDIDIQLSAGSMPPSPPYFGRGAGQLPRASPSGLAPSGGRCEAPHNSRVSWVGRRRLFSDDDRPTRLCRTLAPATRSGLVPGRPPVTT